MENHSADQENSCRHVIYDSSDLLVVSNLSQHSSSIVLAFGDMITVASADNPWGERPAISNNLDVISFMSRKRNWYPECVMQKALRLVREISAKYDKVICYGGSMGGYAALRYSSALNADVVISYVPQFSIDPAYIDDRRFKKYFDSRLNKGMEPKAEDISGKVMIVSDPYFESDRDHVDFFRKIIPSALYVPLANAGHHVTALLADSKFFGDAIRFSEDGMDLHGIIRKARILSKKRPMYYRSLTSKLKIRKPCLYAALLNSARDKPKESLTIFDYAILAEELVEERKKRVTSPEQAS